MTSTMECTVEEYLLSEIKVEDEEFEGQELTDCNDDASGFVAESCGSNQAETTPDIPSGTRNIQSTSVKKSQPVITKCTICHFSTRTC
ncbi:hypothetical protein B566_EDAN016484 [Ephemera danica]|nr:hypothetical protein B566_EDAN016484 [Ephemera danica]